MSPRLGILYRGPLDSCNYGCAYCPFAKREPKKAVLERDRADLARFVAWVSQARGWALEVLFTPYGEALIWPWYREALAQLSRLSHITNVTIQTNASGPMSFLDEADRSRLSLWVSWHPTEIDEDAFAAKIMALHANGVCLSIGAVAVPAHLPLVESLRRKLPTDISFWVNAQKPGPRYAESDRIRWRALDPAFDIDAQRHRVQGAACLTGEDTISVDGNGTIRRCHFVAEIIGNLYENALEDVLKPRPCPRGACDCWIGYSNLPALDLRKTFVEGGALSRRRSIGR